MSIRECVVAKIKISFILIAFLSMIPIGFSISCNQFSSKANQYTIEGETILDFVNVRVENKDYCVFLLNPKRDDISKFIVLDTNGNRVQNFTQSIFGPSENPDLSISIFSFVVYDFVSKNYQTVSSSLNSIDDGLVTDYHQTFSSNLNLIRDGSETLINSLELTPIKIGIIKIDISQPLRELLLKEVGRFFPPKWGEIIDKFRSYEKTVDQIQRSKDRGFVSYDNDVKIVVERTVAIQYFVKEVDEKVGSDLRTEFGSLDFQQNFNLIAQESSDQITKIDSRISLKKADATNSDKIDENLSMLDTEITIGLEKQINMEPYKKAYCDDKTSKPSKDLIEREQFNDYIAQNQKIVKDITNARNNLATEEKSANSKFIINVWIDKFIWAFFKGC